MLASASASACPPHPSRIYSQRDPPGQRLEWGCTLPCGPSPSASADVYGSWTPVPGTGGPNCLIISIWIRQISSLGSYLCQHRHRDARLRHTVPHHSHNSSPLPDSPAAPATTHFSRAHDRPRWTPQQPPFPFSRATCQRATRPSSLIPKRQ